MQASRLDILLDGSVALLLSAPLVILGLLYLASRRLQHARRVREAADADRSIRTLWANPQFPRERRRALYLLWKRRP